jgi:hypothetical protein
MDLALYFSSTSEIVMLGVSMQVFDFPINSGATDMGIPFGYPLLVYLARPNMEKTQYGEGPTRQPEEVVD